MALITCTECGKVFSDKAKACPNCGCPTEYIVEAFETETKQTEPAIARVVKKKTPSKKAIAQVVEKKASSRTTNASKRALDRLSYTELREFAFSSVLPYIKGELNNTVTAVHRGSGDAADAHYYLVCGQRTIGIKVVIDAYPDIFNVGSLFGDDTNEQDIAKRLKEKGYECAVARIGIGAKDSVRFARRMFLKNDSYHFNYKELRFVQYPRTESNIRYSLSALLKDDSWKPIVGFEYTKPPKQTNYYTIEKPRDPKAPARARAISEFWNNGYEVLSNVEQMCRGAYVEEEMSEAISQLVCYASIISSEKIPPKDLLYYICNAVDFIDGVFLSDSTPVAPEKILTVLRELISQTKFTEEYEVECDEATRMNYLIYIFLTDRAKFKKFFTEDYMSKHKGKRLSVIWNIYRATKDAFLENPIQFGYTQDVVDEIERIQNINSPLNLEKYAALKTSIYNEMQQYCLLHERLVSKITLQTMTRADASQLEQWGKNAYQFTTFIEKNFDAKLSAEHKNPMDAFIRATKAYKSSLDYDEIIVNRQLRGNYNIFNRIENAKESKRRYEQFHMLYSMLR